jgi:hypothetical protein
VSVELDWAGAIALQQTAALPDATAHTWIREVETGSRPQIWECDDGCTYYVKHANNPQDHGNTVAGARVLVAERVFGLLAERLGAPCGITRVIDVPQGLIDAVKLVYPDGRALASGLAHGSREIPDVQPGPPPTETASENKTRYARLTILHAWFVPGDVQWLHGVSPPHLIWSVDHAFYLPGQNLWNAQQLLTQPYPVIAGPFPGAGLSEDDLHTEFAPLTALTECDLAQIIGSIPPEWGVPLSDLVELGRWLWSRFERLRAEWS